ncbi:SRPBCC family protein [Paractinoplanes globisporus]|uniref:SRPBCC family protein n=1 Tax=Paractinoplanes globisporus TaxID=113565 RepID=A0ABW6W8J5_9ACTN|nr:SRPBCC family protein [Actinoplanes globisporus]
MPTFTLTARAEAPVEEVWKLLHDPARFPEWWAGIETVATAGDGRYTMWPTGYPDFPMAQQLRADAPDGRVTISCLVSDLVFRWRLRADDEATDIDVEVEIPDREAHRLPDQRRQLELSLATLTALAARIS